MLDSLRSDRMPLYGYDRPTTPFLSSLAEQGKLSNVAMALSTCSESFCGIASTLASHPYHRVTPGNFRLHEILRSVGYRNYLLLTGNHRQWAGLTEFYGPEYDLWYDYITQKLDMHSDQNVLTALNALPEAEGKPTFIFSFLMSTHVLGERLPQFRKYLPDQIEKFLPLWSERSLERSFERIAGTPFALGKLEVLSNNYDNGVLQADWVIRQIFETLQAKGYLEDAMVIILGDHGESLGEHDHVGHNLFLFQQNIQIPMFIWTSKPHRLKNAEFASHVDVAPTVLDFLGLPAAESFEGNSILTQEPRRFTVHQTRRGKQPCAAVVHREQPKHFLKVIMCRVGAQDLHIQAYDLTADPGESSNLWNTFSQSRREQLLKPLQFFSAQVINSCTTDDCLEPKATGES